MNLSKSLEYFDPSAVRERIHIIGCGSVGGFVAELLTRFGLTNFSLYDFDKVEAKNIANQIFTTRGIGIPKVNAVFNYMQLINPDVKAKTKLFCEGYTDQPLSGYVFLCLDDIDMRRKIVTDNRYNTTIRAVFDFRTRLTDCQHYAADWLDDKGIANFLKTMDFTKEESDAETPTSACGTTLCVAPTVRMVAEAGVMNFVRFVKTGSLKRTVLIDVENLTIDAFGN